MKRHHRNAACSVRLSLLALGLASSVLLPGQALAAFGLTNSGGYYTVDTGANLVFKIQQSTGDMTSCKYNGTEYQSSSTTGHVESGFGSSASVSAAVSGTNIIVTCNGTVGGDPVTQYYIAKQGVDNIYMATYVGAGVIGELRWITGITSPATTLDPGMAARITDANAVVIEAGDTFVEPDGTTRSKYMGTDMAKDLKILGKSGGGVGVYMAFGTRESSGGGPFFRDIESGGTTIYNYMYSQHHQTDTTAKTNVLHGPYALMFTNGTRPTAQPDYSFIDGLGLTGYVPASGRGRVVLNGINGRDTNYTYTVQYENANAQYWVTASASGGSCVCGNMKPGTYDMTIFKGQLAVYTASGIVVSAGSPTTLSSRTITADPSTAATVWRIGDWDGTPLEFAYGSASTVEGFPYINTMHPSDVRESWSPVTFTVGTSATTSFPSIQWVDVNNSTTIKFNLTAAQVAAHTVRIGITDAQGGGRPKIYVNSWASSLPSSTVQPDGRSVTIGTYRGNNTTFTYSVPASAFVVGQNTMTVTIISGSGGNNYLSPSVAYDCIDMQ